MELAWTSLFIVVCIALIVSGLLWRGGVYGYPFLLGATFLGFVGPQLPALGRYFPATAVESTIAFTALCALASGLGWATGSRAFKHAMKLTLAEGHLIAVAAGLSLVGAFFFFKISQLPQEIRLSNTPSGIITVYLFLSHWLTYGFIIGALCLFRRYSTTALAVVVFDSLFIVQRLVVSGKKGELTEFVLAIALAAFFQRRIAIPRPIMVIAALLVAIAMNSTADYRDNSLRKEGVDWSGISQIDVVGNFLNILKNGGPEMENAVVLMEQASERDTFDFGLSHWNALIYAFVPQQFVGQKFKEGLLIDLPQPGRDYNPGYGTTQTGMSDAFQSFWYLGAIKFFLIAYLMSRLYRTALDGWAVAQIVYIVSIMPAMECVTHSTQTLLSAWFQMAVMLIPFLLLARTKPVHDATMAFSLAKA